MPKDFEYLSPITHIEAIAVNTGIRDLPRLRRLYGQGRWRKLKGVAVVRYFEDSRIVLAEVHWYEAHGIGRFEEKVKVELEDR